MNKKRYYSIVLLLLAAALITGCSFGSKGSKSVSVIGGADGPTSIFIAGKTATAVPSKTAAPQKTSKPEQVEAAEIKENGRYSSKEEVAEYIRMYDKLPPNFIKKKEAEALGWNNKEGNLWEVTDELSIGGDYFSNREKQLPHKKGRKWTECDINYNGGYRGAERIVFSNDGLLYYTDDHYKSFSELKKKE